MFILLDDVDGKIIVNITQIERASFNSQKEGEYPTKISLIHCDHYLYVDNSIEDIYSKILDATSGRRIVEA